MFSFNVGHNSIWVEAEGYLTTLSLAFVSAVRQRQHITCDDYSLGSQSPGPAHVERTCRDRVG